MIEKTPNPNTEDLETPLALRVSAINAGYMDRPVLYNVSLQVREGERMLLIGPNGCGKTTLLKVIAGVLMPASGTAWIGTHDVSRTSLPERIQMGLGYLKQTHNIFASLTVEENLHLGFWHGNGDYEGRRNQILTTFPMLRNRLKSRAGLLSGGERQALAIGMVLMRPINVLLLDEPTAGLSPKAATSILEALHQAQEELGYTSLIVEHNLKQVKPWVSCVVAMKLGEIVAHHDHPDILTNKELLHRYYF